MARSSQCDSTLIAAVVTLAAVIQPSNGGTASDQQIFRVLLTRHSRSISDVAVVDATPIPVLQPTAAQWRALGSNAVNALKSNIENASEGAPDVFTAASFPRSTTVVAHDELQPLRRGPDLAVRWREFEERYGTREFFAFSRPVVSDDGLDALVYRSDSDGPESGVLELFCLRRASTSDTWSIAKYLPITIS